jgi:hypothetical protein
MKSLSLRELKKENGERVVVILGFDVNVPGAGAFVHELDVRALEAIQGLAAANGISPDRSDRGCCGPCHLNL